MCDRILTFLRGLLYENGTPSRTGLIGLLIALVPLFVWSFVTLYLVLTHGVFQHYSDMTLGTFGTSVGGGGVVAGNKYINSLMNAVGGRFPDKAGPDAIPPPVSPPPVNKDNIK